MSLPLLSSSGEPLPPSVPAKNGEGACVHVLISYKREDATLRSPAPQRAGTSSSKRINGEAQQQILQDRCLRCPTTSLSNPEGISRECLIHEIPNEAVFSSLYDARDTNQTPDTKLSKPSQPYIRISMSHLAPRLPNEDMYHLISRIPKQDVHVSSVHRPLHSGPQSSHTRPRVQETRKADFLIRWSECHAAIGASENRSIDCSVSFIVWEIGAPCVLASRLRRAP